MNINYLVTEPGNHVRMEFALLLVFGCGDTHK